MNNIIGKSWRDSASLIVLTKRLGIPRVEDSVNYEILLQTRTESASFANSVVFPGGVCEAADGSPRWVQLIRSFGFTNQNFETFHRPGGTVTPIFKDNPIQRHIQLRITAIRETFEEVGLLICSKQHKKDRAGLWADVIEDVDVKYWQARVSKNPADLLTLCEELQCYPDIWSLNYWSNWLSPLNIPKRFDTAFFVTGLQDKPAVTRNSEVAHVQWASPTEILSSSKVVLYPPQIYEFRRLSCIKDIDQLVKFASERSGYAVPHLYPIVVRVKDGMLHLLPGDDLYPSIIDYNDNTIEYIDKTILELREGCKTINRAEFDAFNEQSKFFLVQNYSPEHHIKMEDTTFPTYAGI